MTNVIFIIFTIFWHQLTPNSKKSQFNFQVAKFYIPFFKISTILSMSFSVL